MIDKLVAFAKERTNTESSFAEKVLELESDTVRFCVSAPNKTSIHVYRGIKELADEVGSELKKCNRDALDYVFKYSFEHEGVLFHQISNSEVPE